MYRKVESKMMCRLCGKERLEECEIIGKKKEKQEMLCKQERKILARFYQIDW